MSETTPLGSAPGEQLSRAQVLFASANFEVQGMLHRTADSMVNHAQSLSFDGVALMTMRPFLHQATQDLKEREVPGVKLLREPWQLNPDWTNMESIIANAKYRAAMPSTHLGPWQPAARLVAQAREHNPLPVTVYLDPSGDPGRDRKKVERLGGWGNVSARVTARFLEIAGVDSPDGVVNALGERNLLAVLDTFESDSNSQKTGEAPKVASQDWLGPVAAAGLLGGIGFSAYRVDQMRPDPDRVAQSTLEMDRLLFGDLLTGELKGQVDSLREFSVPYIVANIPHEGARQAFDRRKGMRQQGAALILETGDVQRAVATYVNASGIGNAGRLQ